MEEDYIIEVKAMISNLLKRLCLFIIVAIVSGCAEKDSHNPFTIINLEEAFDNNSQCINLGKYAKSIEYIPLETSEISYIGIYPEYRVGDAQIYIAYHNSKSILVFDAVSGKLIRKLARAGRGPGEYLHSENFNIAHNQDIIIADFKKILRYNSEDSCVWKLDASKLGYYNDIIVNIDDESYFINETRIGKDGQLREHSTLIGPNGVISSTEIGDRENAYSLRSKFYSHNKQARIINSANDTIFDLSYDNKLSALYVIELGKKYEYLRQFTSLKNRDYFFAPIRTGVLESDSFVLLSGVLPENELPQIYTKTNYDKHGSSFILYDKNEKKTYALKKSPDYTYIGFINDIDGGVPFSPSIMKDNKMYQFIEADKFIELAEQCNVPSMKEIAATLTEESNPVMVVATLK